MKKFFPLSFKNTTDLMGMIVSIVIYVIIGAVAGALIWLATAIGGWVPVVGAIIGWLLGIVSTLVGLYVFAGIVISILAFLKVVD